MGRYRRRGYRKPRRVKKSTALSRKGAKSQASQILTLQRQITRINRKVKDNTKWCQFRYPQNALIGSVAHPTFGTWNLVNPNQWIPIFQSRASGFQDFATASKFRGRSMAIEVIAQLQPLATVPPIPLSQKPVMCTFFLVSLRKEIGKQFVHDTSNGIDLVEGVHYTQANAGTLQGEGMIMLNKGIFKIRRIKRFMLGGVASFYENEDDELVPTTNLKDNNRRFYWKLPYRNLLKDDGPDARGSTEPSGWKTLDIDQVEPADQLYFLMFSNAYADQAVAVHSNVVFTGTVTNG